MVAGVGWQVNHLRAERDLLVAVADSPWIAALNYSFQDKHNLYMVRTHMRIPPSQPCPPLHQAPWAQVFVKVCKN